MTCAIVGPVPPLPDLAFLYDAGTDSLTRTGDMVWNHVGPTATLLPDGKVSFAEGRDPACETTNKPIPCGGSEVYDPVSGMFSATGDVRGEPWRAGAAAALLNTGDVLVAGGDGGNALLGTADLYQPSSAAFIATGSMSISRGSGLKGVLLPDGTMLISGGGSTNIGITATMELYDPIKGVFSPAGTMSTPRTDHTTTLLSDGSVLISGGFFGSAQDSAEIYRPTVLVPPPALLSVSGDGRSQGAIQHAATYELVTPDNPATAGEVVVIYCTGLADGSAIPPQVAIGGRMAEVLWFGNTPGYPGLDQINVQVPNGIAPAGAVAVRLNYIGRLSNEVTMAIVER